MVPPQWPPYHVPPPSAPLAPSRFDPLLPISRDLRAVAAAAVRLGHASSLSSPMAASSPRARSRFASSLFGVARSAGQSFLLSRSTSTRFLHSCLTMLVFCVFQIRVPRVACLAVSDEAEVENSIVTAKNAPKEFEDGTQNRYQDIGNLEIDPEEFARTLCDDLIITDPEVGTWGDEMPRVIWKSIKDKVLCLGNSAP